MLLANYSCPPTPPSAVLSLDPLEKRDIWTDSSDAACVPNPITFQLSKRPANGQMLLSTAILESE